MSIDGGKPINIFYYCTKNPEIYCLTVLEARTRNPTLAELVRSGDSWGRSVLDLFPWAIDGFIHVHMMCTHDIIFPVCESVSEYPLSIRTLVTVGFSTS